MNEVISKIKKWFSKSDEDYAMHLPENETASFVLSLKEIKIGILSCESGQWEFKYSDSFKDKKGEYKTIVGFPDVEKIYKTATLWPFFRLRIPGLKQPAIQEILEEEDIDKENEVELLKRFGKKTIANPYSLLLL